MSRQSIFEHKHAVSFEYAWWSCGPGPKVRTLVVGTDLSGEGWSETVAGMSLMRAVDAYICGDWCRVRHIAVLPMARLAQR